MWRGKEGSILTVIIGIKHGRDIYIGGDSSSVDGWHKRTERMSKVYYLGNKGEFLIGTCGSRRMAQIIKYQFKPSREKNFGALESDSEYMVNVFAEELRDLLDKKGIVGKSDNDEDDFYGGAIVGYRENLYRLSPNYQVDQFDSSYDAIGSGAPFALGALVALTERVPLKPELLIQKAMKAAETLCIDVSAPFRIEVLKHCQSTTTGDKSP